MKKITACLLCILICVLCCGCNKSNISTQSSTNDMDLNSLEEIIVSNSDTLDGEIEHTTSSQNQKNPPVSTQENNVQNTTSTQSGKEENKVTKRASKLPQISCSKNDANLFYTDIVALNNGGFAAVGYVDGCCVVRIYDKQLNIVTANYKLFDMGSGCSKIAPCEDGGVIVASGTHNYIIKVNNKLEREWLSNFEPIEGSSVVHDVEQISSDCYAVLFDSVFNGARGLKIAFFDKSGKLTDTKEIMAKLDSTDADIISDKKGGFYITATCDKAIADKHSFVKDVYDSSKKHEAAVMHFSDKHELDWATTFGGKGDDWCEEANVDDAGNFYVAICTNSVEEDDFWNMEIDFLEPYRRMLVKLDSKGKIVYTHNLSNKGEPTLKYNGASAIDQVCEIGMQGDTVYVVGLSKYFDGIQDTYECKQILESENASCLYTVAINKDGKEISRDIFKYNADERNYGAAVSKDGSIVICGGILATDNAFNIVLDEGENRSAALFAYKK